ncbi:MAG: hypothetical protein DI498_02175 [Paracoccus denitrificans]|nr:MAG: hypothetical protein DI498_02175 [Paracoccus denitrificans]PZO85961.1 MAG: hypothetical protein DI633_02175 [Paracoccus denitrificans]
MFFNELTYAIVAFGAILGGLRATSVNYRPILLVLAMLVAGATLCGLISGTKSGGFMPGLGGLLCMFFLGLVALGTVLGAALAALWQAVRRRRYRINLLPVDVFVAGGLSVLGVVLSILE